MWFLGVAAAVFVGLSWLERRRPLRRAVDPGRARLATNASLSLATAAVATLLDAPVTRPLARRADALRRGPLQKLPGPVRTLATLVVLDYALYLWHVALHKVPWLWRSHVVHHSDLDLDTTTALRFHAGEIVASIAWRAALVRALGVGERPLALCQQVLFVAVLFHHSNVRLPLWLERRLVRVIVTPRMHGIHHSTVRDETDSNWSSVLTVWDRVHGTLRLDVPQEGVEIGVPGYRRPLRLRELATLPLLPPGDAWREAPPSRASDAPRELPAEG